MTGLGAPTYDSGSAWTARTSLEDIMTTTYDPEFGTETIAAAQYDDPDTYTVAEAWASSPLDDTDGFAARDTTDDRDPAGSRAKLFAALAAGIIGGATLGAVLFGYRAVAPPTVVVPGFGVSTEQLPAAPTTPNPQASQKLAAVQTPASKPLQQTAVPNPVAAETKTNEEVAAAPEAPVDPGTPPVVVPPVVVDVYLPPLGDKPQLPAPEPPKPQPPVFDPPNIDVVQAVPEPDPVMQKPEQPNLQLNEDLYPKPSRWTTKLPENKPNTRKVNTGTSSRATLAKP
jgi:hypothetical protein